jgi:DNA-binding transcriptional regulator YiaG
MSEVKPRLRTFVVHIPTLDGEGVQEVVNIQVPVAIDPDTGEELITKEGCELIDDTKARYMGLLSPTEIRNLRKRLALTQRQISDLLEAGEKSWTRWETGKGRPSRMVNLLLRLLNSGKITPTDVIEEKSVPSAGQSFQYKKSSACSVAWALGSDWMAQSLKVTESNEASLAGKFSASTKHRMQYLGTVDESVSHPA